MERKSTSSQLTLFDLITPAREFFPKDKKKSGLEVLRETFDLSWKEMANLLSEEATAFDGMRSQSPLPPAKLRDRQLQDAARHRRPKAIQAVLKPPCHYVQIIREFGIAPDSLNGNDGPWTLSQIPFSLLWFYAWRHAQRIAALPREDLKQFVSTMRWEGNEEKSHDTILSLTFCNAYPSRKLASITALARNLTYYFNTKYTLSFDDPIPAEVKHAPWVQIGSQEETCRALFPEIVQVSFEEICKIEGIEPIASASKQLQELPPFRPEDYRNRLERFKRSI